MKELTKEELTKQIDALQVRWDALPPDCKLRTDQYIGPPSDYHSLVDKMLDARSGLSLDGMDDLITAYENASNRKLSYIFSKEWWDSDAPDICDETAESFCAMRDETIGDWVIRFIAVGIIFGILWLVATYLPMVSSIIMILCGLYIIYATAQHLACGFKRLWKWMVK